MNDLQKYLNKLQTGLLELKTETNDLLTKSRVFDDGFFKTHVLLFPFNDGGCCGMYSF